MPSKQYSWQVGEDDVRADQFLRSLSPRFSMGAVQRMIAKGAFFVGSRPIRKGDRLKSGQTVNCKWDLAALPRASDNPHAAIVYEDPLLGIVNKPSGMPTLALDPLETGTLTNDILKLFPTCRNANDALEAGIVHRLDNMTSGLVLVAKNEEILQLLQAANKAEKITKKYVAVVHGNLKQAIEIDLPIAADSGGSRKMTASTKLNNKSRPALTKVTPLASSEGFTLVEATINKGARHQIRVHLASQKHPIVGDQLYHEQESDYPFHFLHACAIECAHPTLQQDIQAHAYPDWDLKTLFDFKSLPTPWQNRRSND